MWDDVSDENAIPTYEEVEAELGPLVEVTSDNEEDEEEEPASPGRLVIPRERADELTRKLQAIVDDHKVPDGMRIKAMQVRDEVELNRTAGIPYAERAAVLQVASESIKDPEALEKAAEFGVRIVEEAVRIIDPSIMNDNGLDPEPDMETVDAMRLVVQGFSEQVRRADAADTQQAADRILLESVAGMETAIDKMQPQQLVNYLKAMRKVGQGMDTSVAPLVAAVRQVAADPLITLGLEKAERDDDNLPGPQEIKTGDQLLRARQNARVRAAVRTGSLLEAAEEESSLYAVQHDSQQAAEQFRDRTENYEWEEKETPLQAFLGSKVRLSTELRGYLAVAARTGHLEALMREIDFGEDKDSLMMRQASVKQLRSLAVRTQLDALKNIPNSYHDAMGKMSATLEQVRAEDMVQEVLADELTKPEEKRLSPGRLAAKLAALAPERARAPEQQVPARNYSLFFADFARGLVNSAAHISEHVPLVLKQSGEALERFTAKQSTIRIASRQRYDSAYTALLQLLTYMTGAATNLHAVLRDMAAILDKLPSNSDIEDLAKAAATPESKRTEEQVRQVKAAAFMARMRYLPLIQLYYGGFKRVYKAFNIAACTYAGILADEGLPEVRSSALWYNVKQNCPEFDLDDGKDEPSEVQGLVRNAIARAKAKGANLINALRYTDAYMASSGLLPEQQTSYWAKVASSVFTGTVRTAASIAQLMARVLAGGAKLLYNVAVHLKESWIGRAGFGIRTIGDSVGVILRLLVFSVYSYSTGQFSVPAGSTIGMRLGAVLATPLFAVCMGYSSIDGLLAIFRYAMRALTALPLTILRQATGISLGKLDSMADNRATRPILSMIIGASGHAALMRIWRTFCAALGALALDTGDISVDAISQLWLVPSSIAGSVRAGNLAGSAIDAVTGLSLAFGAMFTVTGNNVPGVQEWLGNLNGPVRFVINTSATRLALMLVHWLVGSGVTWAAAGLFAGAIGAGLLSKVPAPLANAATAVGSTSRWLAETFLIGSQKGRTARKALQEATLRLSRGMRPEQLKQWFEAQGLDIDFDPETRRFTGQGMEDAADRPAWSRVWSRIVGSGLGDIVDDVNPTPAGSPYDKMMQLQIQKMKASREVAQALMDRTREVFNGNEEEVQATVNAMANSPFFMQQMMVPGVSVLTELGTAFDGIADMSPEARLADLTSIMGRVPGAFRLIPSILGASTGLTQFDFSPSDWEQLCADATVVTETYLPVLEYMGRQLIALESRFGVAAYSRDKFMLLIKQVSPGYYKAWEAKRARKSKALADLIAEDQVGFREFQEQANARLEALEARCNATMQMVNDQIELQQARSLMIDRSRSMAQSAQEQGDRLKQQVQAVWEKTGKIWQSTDRFQIELSRAARNERLMRGLGYAPSQGSVARTIATQLMLSTNMVRSNQLPDLTSLDDLLERQKKTKAEDSAKQALVLRTGIRRRRRRRR